MTFQVRLSFELIVHTWWALPHPYFQQNQISFASTTILAHASSNYSHSKMSCCKRGELLICQCYEWACALLNDLRKKTEIHTNHKQPSTQWEIRLQILWWWWLDSCKNFLLNIWVLLGTCNDKTPALSSDILWYLPELMYDHILSKDLIFISNVSTKTQSWSLKTNQKYSTKIDNSD